MSAIEIPVELLRPLEELAVERGETVDILIAQLVGEYLREQRHLFLLEEMERFRLQHDTLRKQFEGLFVALRNGQVLDSDADGALLYERLRHQYGELPILVVEVTDQPEQLFIRLASSVTQ